MSSDRGEVSKLSAETAAIRCSAKLGLGFPPNAFRRINFLNLITLLFSFMGEALTMRLLQESWAEVRAQDLGSRK